MLGSQDNRTDVSTQLLGTCVLSGAHSLSDFMKEEELFGDEVIRKTRYTLQKFSFSPLPSLSSLPAPHAHF